MRNGTKEPSLEAARAAVDFPVTQPSNLGDPSAIFVVGSTAGDGSPNNHVVFFFNNVNGYSVARIDENGTDTTVDGFVTGERELLAQHETQCLPGTFEESTVHGGNVKAFVSTGLDGRAVILWQIGTVQFSVTAPQLTVTDAVQLADNT
jgi:hypothetical protein